MGHAGKAAQGCSHLLGAQAHLQTDRHRHQHVLAIVGTGHRQGIGWQQWSTRLVHLIRLDPEMGFDAGGTGLLPALGRHPTGLIPADGAAAQVGIIGVEHAHR